MLLSVTVSALALLWHLNASFYKINVLRLKALSCRALGGVKERKASWWRSSWLGLGWSCAWATPGDQGLHRAHRLACWLSAKQGWQQDPEICLMVLWWSSLSWSDTWSGLQELCLAPPNVVHPTGLLKLGVLGSKREDTAQTYWNSLNVLSFWASYSISHLIDRALGEDWEYSSQHNKDGFSGGGWFCSRRDDYFNTIKNEQYEFGHLQP